MARAPSRKRSTSKPRFPRGARARSCLVALALTATSASAWAGEVTMLPSATGHFGAWLAVGPIPGSPKGATSPRQMGTALLGVDDAAVVGKLGQPVVGREEGSPAGRTPALAWRLVSAPAGPIDVAQALDVGNLRNEAFAYLFGVLHVEQPFKGTLLLGSNDGARVFLDQVQVWSSDSARPQRDEEDAVPLRLAAGDHRVVVKLHHREGYWAVRTRIVNERFVTPPGVTLRLPGTSDADARKLGTRMVDIAVDRGLSPSGFAPIVTASFPEGLPTGIGREVRITAAAAARGTARQLLDLRAGQVEATPSGTTPLRVLLPELTRDELGDAELADDGQLTVAVEIAGRKLEASLSPRPFMHDALRSADRALASELHVADPAVTRATLEHLRERLVHDVGAGSSDLAALSELAGTIGAYADDLAAGRDPLRTHAGIRRFAYRSDIDGQLSPFGVYVPASFAAGSNLSGKTYPLVVALHGMNGRPLSMVRWVFGQDDPDRDSEWEDRHTGEVEPFEGFVIAPNAFGNGMYRELGEVDVMRVLAWATRFFPIDPDRVTITGVSMGGTGTASIALHYPDRFAAAMPLCGYHSYLIRRDLLGRRLRSWERLLADQRTNASWAENGLHLPMFVWHGKRDLPEANSGVLIDRYFALGYAMRHEHPDVGHEVWRRAYEAGSGLAWLASQRRAARVDHVVFRTNSPRYVDNRWVHLREIPTDLSFAAIDARMLGAGKFEVTTEKVGSFALDREGEVGSEDRGASLTVDGTKLTFAPGAPLVAHKGEHGWTSGAPSAGPEGKRAGLSGPIRDAFYEPLVFVYGTQDPAMVAVNREIARDWSRLRYGAEVHYPLIADDELDDELARTHALVLVGSASSNRVVRELDASLPFHVRANSIVGATSAGARQWRGKDLGVVFIYPNPRHPERYIVVIEGTTALGTFQATALPDLLPDFMVFGTGIAAARGQLVLGPARPLAAGLFRPDWSLGSVTPD